MRTKKEIREKLSTQMFFHQAGSDFICPCGQQACAVGKSGVEAESLQQTPGGMNAAAANMEAACRQFDEMTKSLEELCAIDAASEDANLDRENIGGTFELRDIKGVLQLVISLEEIFRREHHRKMGTVKTTIAEIQLAAAISHVESLSGNLNRIIWRYREWNEAVNFALCFVQLHNLEKRFSFFREDCRHLKRQSEAWPNEMIEQDSPTLRKIFSDPTNMLADETPRKNKRRKARDINEALAEMRRLNSLMIKDVQAVRKSTPNEKAKAPSLPADLTYEGSRISNSVPLAIRQSAFDLEFICEEIHEMRGRVLNQREMVRCSMTIWATTSKITWEYGKAHIHEFPDMRKYEYMRISLRAAYFLAFQEEIKIMSYLLSGNCPETLCQQLGSTFLKDGRDIAKMSAEFDERVGRLAIAFPPLEEMVVQLADYSKEVGEEAKKDGWSARFRKAPSRPSKG